MAQLQMSSGKLKHAVFEPNQIINAQIKLLEIWKSINIEKYKIKTNFVTRNNEVALTRACSAGYLDEKRLSNTSSRSFLNDAIHIWNQAPMAIKSCSTIYVTDVMDRACACLKSVKDHFWVFFRA